MVPVASTAVDRNEAVETRGIREREDDVAVRPEAGDRRP
jgi:hypothetical protein